MKAKEVYERLIGKLVGKEIETRIRGMMDKMQIPYMVVDGLSIETEISKDGDGADFDTPVIIWGGDSDRTKPCTVSVYGIITDRICPTHMILDGTSYIFCESGLAELMHGEK